MTRYRHAAMPDKSSAIERGRVDAGSTGVAIASADIRIPQVVATTLQRRRILAAQSADLWPDRRGAGGRRLHVFAVASCRAGLWLRWVALAIFIAAAITDFLDGYFARTVGQQSSLGRMLDPIADKLLVASCLLMLAADGTIRGWSLLAAIIILCREILVSGLREYLAELRVSVPVTQLAKWKTTLQLVAIGFLIAGEAGDIMIPALITTD